MPQQPGKQKVDSKPSPGLLRRLLGGPLPESVYQEYPELAQAWTEAEMNMPRETTMTNRVAPMGPLQRLLYGNNYAAMSPLTRTIGLNMPLIQKDQQNVADILTHELTHIGQKPSLMGGIRKYYTKPENMPEEQEALEAERKRPRPRDIYLPPEKKVRY